MNCSEANLVMPLYLSSELDPMPMVEFELHIQQCRRCAKELEYVKDCDELLRTACLEQQLNAGPLRERVLNEISQFGRRRRFLFRRRPYSLPIAAVLLIAVATGIFLFLRDGSSQIVYAAVLDDHYAEVVQHPVIQGWRETPEEIRAFVREQLGEAGFLDRLAPADYHLTRARHCDLPDHASYVHLVFKNDAHEISIYVRRKGGELPGAIVEMVNGCALHATAINKFEISGFQSEGYTVLVVGDLPRAESLRIARNAALALA